MAQSFETRDTVTLNEVIVTGTKIGIARNQIPFTVTQIPNNIINLSGESAVLSILSESTPGVFVTERGVAGFGVSNGSAGQITIRGIGGNPNTGVLVLVNGNPQYAGIFGHPLPDTYLSSDIEKVEIIRGPASVLYGSNAMGGIINILTKRQYTDGLSLKSRLSYGSFKTSELFLSAGFKEKNFGLLTSVNYNSSAGHRPNSDFKLLSGYFKSFWDINDNYKIETDISISQTDAADPGLQSTGQIGYSTDIFRTNANAAFKNEFEKFSGSAHVFFNYGENEVTDGFSSIDRNYGFSFYESAKLIDGNTITIGADFKTYGGIAKNSNANNGRGVTFGDTTVTESALYFLVQQEIAGSLILNAGYRLDRHNVHGYEHVPSAGLAYFISGSSTIKASVSKGFRNPTIRELFLFLPANDQLKPERTINYEIGLMQKLFSDKLAVEATVFKTSGSNLIQTVFGGGTPKNVNSGDFSNYGFEMSAKFHQNNFLNYILNYTYIHSDKPILAAPEHSIYFTANYGTGKFNLSMSLKNIINLNTRILPRVEKENYFLLNSIVHYRMNENVILFFKAENILNEDYQINYDYPMPGTSLLAGLNFNL